MRPLVEIGILDPVQKGISVNIVVGIVPSLLNASNRRTTWPPARPNSFPSSFVHYIQLLMELPKESWSRSKDWDSHCILLKETHDANLIRYVDDGTVFGKLRKGVMAVLLSNAPKPRRDRFELLLDLFGT